nr:S41 family peptidase [uncultured Macellibacteroides sp.]
MSKLFYCVLSLFVLWGCSSESEYLETLVQVTPDEKILEANTNHNRWIYTQMNDHYYWRKDIPDSASLNFAAEPSAFFKSLLSKNDRFSWCELNSNYSGNSEQIYLPDKIGFEYQSYRDSRNQLIHQVLYVTRTNAKDAGIARGDWVKLAKQSGSDCILEKGDINKGYFSSVGQIAVSLNSATSATTVNNTLYMDSIYTIGNKKIGYMVYLQYEDKVDLFPAFSYFRQKGIDELILDLRYNPGGYVSTAALLSGLIVKQTALGKIFQLQEYNNIQGNILKKETGDSILVEKIPSSSVVLQNNLDLDKLYVITTSHTASASESTIIGLRPYMNVITIGETSYGKGVGSYTLQDPRYKYQLQPITFRYYNALHITVPDTGLVPDYYTEETTSSQAGLGETTEPLLQTALSVITGGTNARSSGSGIHTKASPSAQLIKVGEASFAHKYNFKNNSLK